MIKKRTTKLIFKDIRDIKTFIKKHNLVDWRTKEAQTIADIMNDYPIIERSDRCKYILELEKSCYRIIIDDLAIDENMKYIKYDYDQIEQFRKNLEGGRRISWRRLSERIGLEEKELKQILKNKSDKRLTFNQLYLLSSWLYIKRIDDMIDWNKSK